MNALGSDSRTTSAGVLIAANWLFVVHNLKITDAAMSKKIETLFILKQLFSAFFP